LFRFMEDVFEKGDGSWVTMHSGRRLLDFTSGIGTTNLGTSGGLSPRRLSKPDS
jgi:acetylornithine/succinyldiaminopimelate/putrescine aminotransferase